MDLIRKTRAILAIVICITTVICGCSESAEQTAATKDISNAGTQTSDIRTSGAYLSENSDGKKSESQSPEEENSGSGNSGGNNNEDAASDNGEATVMQVIEKRKLRRKKFNLSVPYVSQYPELPTGCEIVSLTMLLNRLGYNVDKEYMADECLVYGDSYVTSYSGDPHTENGSGVYPPGIISTVKEFAKKNSTVVEAVDLTGTSMEDLYKLIENGYPIMIWTTLRMEYPDYDDDSYFEEYNGIKYQ